jgi:putative transposase
MLLLPRLFARTQSSGEVEAIRRSLQRGQPFGSGEWTAAAAKRLGLESTMRARGRPRKNPSSELPEIN